MFEMTIRSRFAAIAATLGLSLVLASCSNFTGTFTAKDDVEALRRAAPPGATTFAGNLATEYLALSENQLAEYHWGEASHFAQKGLLAARGSLVLPDEVASRSIAADKVGE